MAQQRRAQARPEARADTFTVLRPAELAALRQRLHSVIEPVVSAARLYLEELSLVRAGRRYVVRVTLDGDVAVNHDDLGEVSREISAVLDTADGELDSYTLEVSSPGVDRPLTLPRHWRRSLGRLVTVRAGQRTVTGRVAGVDDDGVTLDEERFAFPDLGPGRVQVEFTRLDEISDDDLDDLNDLDDADDQEEVQA